MEPTVVTFPSGATEATGTVLLSQEWHDRHGIVTDVTPFHPVDHIWPDQPADRGTLAGRPVVDCATGAVGPGGELLIGADIPVRRGEAGWTWVAVHLLEPGRALPQAGDEVDLRVDADYRRALSSAHTACHLAALALNEATAPLWRKDAPRLDSLGNPDLDGLAVAESRIGPWRSTDRYRLGKSIRKKGLDTEALLEGLEQTAERVTARLALWRATGAAVTIDTGGDPGVAARRTWNCALPDGAARYPCGGTHLSSLAELPEATRVEYSVSPEGFVAETILD